MLKILQARLQQYMNHELPDVQAGVRKGRGTRDQIANIHWITEKAREFQKNIYFCFSDYPKTLTVWLITSCENYLRDGNIRPPYLSPLKPVEKETASKLGKIHQCCMLLAQNIHWKD